MKWDVLFRVDADAKIGIGHMRRCQALMEGFQRAGLKRFAFATRTPETFREWFGKKYTLYPLKAQNFKDEVLELKRIFFAGEIRFMIVDRYGISAFYLAQLKIFIPRLISLNDDAVLKDYPVDAIVNYNVYAEKLKYPSSTRAKLFLGPKYVPIRAEFLEVKDVKTCKGIPKVFVALGGYARAEYLEKIRRALEKLNLPLRLAWASGRTRHVARAMAGADLAVSAGGVTTYELASLGIPTMILILAENQRRIASEWQRRGSAIALGRLRDISQTRLAREVRGVLCSETRRRRMRRQALKVIDGKGGERLARELIKHFGG